MRGGCLAAAALLLGGCYGTTGSPYASGETVYAAGQPGYPYGQPVYSNGQPVYGQPVYSQPYAMGADDYVYYPEAGVYYSTNRHEYLYPDNGRWVRRHDGAGVSVWGPSVHLWFHDSPERHHAEVMRAYPRTWRGDRHDYHRDRDHDDDRR